MGLLSVLLWLPALAIKFLLFLVGLVVVPFTDADNPVYGNNENPWPPAWYRKGQPLWWRDYLWRAWRNPVNNVRYFFTEPSADIVRGVLSPDEVVRKGLSVSAWRWTRASLYSEYWYLREFNYKYYEFRIGWKFSGVPGFAPTLQLGVRNR